MKKVYSKRYHAIKNGFRSGLEETIANQLTAKNIPYEYEEKKNTVKYIIPVSNHAYLPDFKLPNGIIVETKGRFVLADRKKHTLIKEQHPELDIRFVFSNSNAKLSKGSKTTYAMWCDKLGIKYADKAIPDSWISG
jgi:hypothetical protein